MTVSQWEDTKVSNPSLLNNVKYSPQRLQSFDWWHADTKLLEFKINKYTYWQSRGRQVGVCQAQNVRAHTAPSAPVTVWAWSCFEASAVATFACITYNIRASEKGEAPSRLQPALSGTLPLMRAWVQHSETLLLIRWGMRSGTNLKDTKGGRRWWESEGTFDV